jgi:hypothetical protein
MHLSNFERRLFWKSLFLLPFIHIGLSLIGYSRLCKMIEKITPLKPIRQQKIDFEINDQAFQISQMVSIAARNGFFRATCLRRSLLIWWFLRRQGIDSKIRFGVRTLKGQLEAHAWVEINTKVISEWDNTYKDYLSLGSEFPPTRAGL